MTRRRASCLGLAEGCSIHIRAHSPWTFRNALGDLERIPFVLFLDVLSPVVRLAESAADHTDHSSAPCQAALPIGHTGSLR
jgi:hypothetical protein